jgi:pimeloyl-ACP methyl ester carboxylesterase
VKCDLGDSEIFYEACGAGRPIVILPGIPSDHGIMVRFMEPLFTQRDGWLRIYPDLPGTGHTPGVDHLATPDQILDALLRFIDTIIPDQRFVLAGYSYGGYLSRGVVYQRAASIDGLMLCAPMMKADPAQVQLPPKTTLVADPALIAQLDPGMAELIVVQSSSVVEAARGVLEEVQTADFPFLAQLEKTGFSLDVDILSAPFGAPALILTARQDHICGYRDAWELLENYPRATFSVLDRAGHLVTIEQDALCHALMHEWLDRVEEYAADLTQVEREIR